MKDFWTVVLPDPKRKRPEIHPSRDHELYNSVRTNAANGIEVYGSYQAAWDRACQWAKPNVGE